MKLQRVDLTNPFVREEVLPTFCDWAITTEQNADSILDRYARRSECVSVTAHSPGGEFMGFAIAAYAPAGDEWLTRAIAAYPILQLPGRRNPWIVAELHVAKAFRRCGVATSLLRAIEDRSPRVDWAILGVNETNEPARRLYAKLGWKPVATFIPQGWSQKQILYEKHLGRT